MTYAMTLDNSWEVMNEEEMYDVNGGNAAMFVKNIVGLAAMFAALGVVGKTFGKILKTFASSSVSKFFAWTAAKWAAFTATHAKLVNVISTALYVTVIVGAVALGVAMWNTRVFY